jgi:hypothetical protein
MERIKIDFNGKQYDAAKFFISKCDGIAVDCDIIIAENAIDDAFCKIYDSKDSDAKWNAHQVDDTIFGFAPKELVCNGSLHDLKAYAVDLYN